MDMDMDMDMNMDMDMDMGAWALALTLTVQDSYKSCHGANNGGHVTVPVPLYSQEANCSGQAALSMRQ